MPFCFSSSPVCLLHLKGLVLPTSSPAAQVSVCSNGGCATDGTTAPMGRTNTAATTPPILPSVSLLRFHPSSESKQSQKVPLKNTFLTFTPLLSFLLRGHRSGDVSQPQLQPHLLPQHLAVHRRSTGSSLPPATVQSKRSHHFL